MKFIRNTFGNGYPLVIAAVLAILIISCAIFEYMRLVIIATGVRDAVQSSIIAVATENYAQVYNGLREGYSGGYTLTAADTWSEQFSTCDVYARLDQTLGLTVQGNKHIKYAGTEEEFAVSGLNISVQNAPFAPASPSTVSKFEAEGTITLEVPFSFGWHALPPMKSTLTVKAGYTPKF